MSIHSTNCKTNDNFTTKIKKWQIFENINTKKANFFKDYFLIHSFLNFQDTLEIFKFFISFFSFPEIQTFS